MWKEWAEGKNPPRGLSSEVSQKPTGTKVPQEGGRVRMSKGARKSTKHHVLSI